MRATDPVGTHTLSGHTRTHTPRTSTSPSLESPSALHDLLGLCMWSRRPSCSPLPDAASTSTQEHLLPAHSQGTIKTSFSRQTLLNAGFVPGPVGVRRWIRCGPALARPPGLCGTQPSKQIAANEVLGYSIMGFFLVLTKNRVLP